MTLISLLIIMALERVTSKDPNWHISSVAQRYFNSVEKRFSYAEGHVALGVTLILPVLCLYVLEQSIDWVLFSFVLQLYILWLCLGCPITRKTYKRYLQSANRQDFEACSLHSIALGNQSGDLRTVGKQLVFVNYRQYAAVVIYFIVFGAPGVLLYSIARELQAYLHRSTQGSQCTDHIVLPEDQPEPQANLLIDKIMYWIDWLPVRVTGLGFLIVGHFSRALQVWLPYLFNFNVSSKDFLTEVAIAAEEVDTSTQDCVQQPATLVRLAKRNVSFMLVLVALLTMVGAVA